MALEVRRKEKESIQSLIRRFSKGIQRSGILTTARKRMFKKRDISEEKKKRAALRKELIKKIYQKIEKTGKASTPEEMKKEYERLRKSGKISE